MHLLRSLVAILLFALFAAPVAAQTDTVDYVQAKRTPSSPKRPFKDRLWFGGGLNLTFGTVTNVGVSPVVGYKIDEKGKWSAGIGLSYNYFQDNRYVPVYKTSNYGYQIFTRYRVIPQVYLHAEFDQISYERYDPGMENPGRFWVPYLLVGGGISQPIADNAYLTFQILWDVLQDPLSPYGGQPWITGGVGVGF